MFSNACQKFAAENHDFSSARNASRWSTFLKILQQENEFAVRLKADETTSIWKSDVKAWTLNSQEMIEYNESLYVLEDLSVREELLKRHHDDLLAKHFDADKISELLNCKYYWKSMIKNVKEYINTCDICQRVKIKCHLSYDELRSLFRFTNSWKKNHYKFHNQSVI